MIPKQAAGDASELLTLKCVRFLNAQSQLTGRGLTFSVAHRFFNLASVHQLCLQWTRPPPPDSRGSFAKALFGLLGMFFNLRVQVPYPT